MNLSTTSSRQWILRKLSNVQSFLLYKFCYLSFLLLISSTCSCPSLFWCIYLLFFLFPVFCLWDSCVLESCYVSGKFPVRPGAVYLYSAQCSPFLLHCRRFLLCKIDGSCMPLSGFPSPWPLVSQLLILEHCGYHCSHTLVLVLCAACKSWSWFSC